MAAWAPATKGVRPSGQVVLTPPGPCIERYGNETTVVKIHGGNSPHDEMDQRAIACVDQALVDAGLDDDDRLRQVLHNYFA